MLIILVWSVDLDRLEKESEWFHPHSRILVVSDSESALPVGSRTTRRAQPVVAYGVFRFDTEENENDSEDEVLYW